MFISSETADHARFIRSTFPLKDGNTNRTIVTFAMHSIDDFFLNEKNVIQSCGIVLSTGQNLPTKLKSSSRKALYSTKVRVLVKRTQAKDSFFNTYNSYFVDYQISRKYQKRLIMCIRTTEKQVLAPENQWLEKFNLESFTADIKELGERLDKNQGPKDVAHLNKMIRWSNICGIVGLSMMGFGVNLYAIIGLSTFTFTRWTMIAHHTCHGGYDKCHPNKVSLNHA